MSEDSIASDSISCRTEANAPLLPPRKRLLAGLKQNGWSSPSSSSCAAAAPVEPPQIVEAPAIAKREAFDQNSVDAVDGGSLQSLNGTAESVDSHNKSRRKPKRQRASSLLSSKKSSKKKKTAGAESDGNLKDDSPDAEVSLDVDKVKASDAISLSPVKAKDDADADAVASKISSVVEEHSIALGEGDTRVEEKEERVATANGGASPEHGVDSKPDSNYGSVLKEEDEVTCKEARNTSRNLASKVKKGSIRGTTVNHTQKRRRNPNRQIHSKNKEAELKKQGAQREKVSQLPLPLADEELARQLHRAMNSSPRIARCLSLKEERPLLSSVRKHFPGS